MRLTITPCLWFNGQAEQAVKFYTGIFKDSKVTATAYYTDAGEKEHGHKPGTVMTLSFELNGQAFTALNGGPDFHFTEAISFQIPCKTQEEIDFYWDKLSEGGPVEAQVCGWVKDKFGVSWQIFPEIIADLFTDPDRDKASRAMQAMFGMKKMDLAELKRAAEG